MFIAYSIVWVSPDQPDVIQDVYYTGYERLEDAKLGYEELLEYPVNDGLDWIPRITKVTEEFI